MIENLDLEPRTTYRGKLSYDEFIARLKVQMRREHRELRDPEGDVPPRVAFYFGERIFEKQLEPQWFDSRGTKDFLTEQIVRMVKAAPLLGGMVGWNTPVQYVGLIYGMFRVAVNLDDLTEEERAYAERSEIPPGHKAPREHPDREEVLSIVAIDREIVKPFHALIERHKKRPPRLGPWEDFITGPQPGWDMPAGLMVDPIREAMR